MELKHEESTSLNRFYLVENDKVVGEMIYTFAKDHVIDINHTEIDSAYRGQSLGQQLIDAVIDYIKSNNLKAMASCPYAEKMLRRHDSYDDIKA